ncbi:MAG: response regulator [Gemmatimonadaceae bacterium]|nr:response regulator [Gemmatimonadaceae bacterium]
MGLRPEVVVIDASVDQHRSKYPLLQLLADVDPPIPAIVVGGKESLIDRTMALRLGARSFLRKPIAAAKVVAEAERILRRLRPQRGRVLVADDDPATLAALKAILVGAGLDVVTIADPLQVLSTLQAERFDLLILDREMPHLGGLELCRVLRSDPRWHGLPILILAEHRADIIHQIFDAGADDIVVRPIVDQELVTRVANRLERSRIYRNMSDTDLLTGLPNRWKAAEIIELLRRMAKRYLEPLSVAIIGIDDLRGIVERHGGAAGDEVICRLAELLVRTFRGEDVAGRWSDDRFVLALYGIGREDSAARLRIALDEFQRIESRDGQGEVHPATFSAGIAVFPADGADLPALGHAAELALRTAEARGRGHIEAQVDETLASPGGQPIDVLIVEADEALTDLLTHTLEARGYRTLALLDGHDALTWLGPDSSAPGARVILMAVDLPGLDGLALLRRLKEMGITRTSRVIMLTARASEPEVLEALRAGAFDHVSKPFSVPVLMQRVSQALEV